MSTKGQNLGYRRGSTTDKSTARQLDGLALDHAFEDHTAGKDVKRPGLEACLGHVREGDTLHVHSMVRLARNLVDLLGLVKDLTGRGVTIPFRKEGLIFSGEASPMQELQLAVMGAVAQFERTMIRERQREGIEIAKREGCYNGRPPKLDEEQVAAIIARAHAG